MSETETFNINDDLLTEILARLPPESLLRFKSVSRDWRDLLSSPAFLRRHASAYRDDGRLVAFFQEAEVFETSDATTATRCNALPLCMDEENYINVPRHVGNFLHSSNGLILCSRSRGTVVTYYVGNPSSGKFVELPLPYSGKRCLILDDQQLDKYDRCTSWATRKKPPLLSTGLITGKGVPPVYTVLRAGMYCHNRSIVHIDSYSSESGKWTRLKQLVATNSLGLSEMPPVVANGVVHWYTESRDIAVYDPEDRDNHVQLIKVPTQRKDKNLKYAFTRTSADDDVLWLAIQRRKSLLFYMLPKESGGYKRKVDIDSTEWVLMHDVSIVAISKLMKRGLIACESFYLDCLIPESKSEVVAVLEQEGKVFLYNVQRDNIVKLDYSGRLNPYLTLYPYFRSRLLSLY